MVELREGIEWCKKIKKIPKLVSVKSVHQKSFVQFTSGTKDLNPISLYQQFLDGEVNAINRN